jgi:membrane protein
LTEQPPGTHAGRGARSPFHPIRLWEAATHFMGDDGLVMAGHMTFITLVSLFPFLIFLMALAGFFGQTEGGTRFVAFALESLPPEIAAVLEQPILEVVQERRGGLLTLGILTSIWTASSGIEAARDALNRAYETGERPPFWRSRLESIGLVILAPTVIVVAVLLLVLGPVAWQAAQGWLHLPEPWEGIWDAVRYVFGAAVMFAGVALLYTVLPRARLRARWILPGAAITVGLWLLAATGFSIFVTNFGSYTVTYGSLGGVVVALVFFYLMGALFIYGAEVNAAIARAEGGLPRRQRRRRAIFDLPKERK